MVKDIGKWPSDTINSPKSGRHAVAERNLFQSLCKIDMDGINSTVIWEMPVQAPRALPAAIWDLLSRLLGLHRRRSHGRRRKRPCRHPRRRRHPEPRPDANSTGRAPSRRRRPSTQAGPAPGGGHRRFYRFRRWFHSHPSARPFILPTLGQSSGNYTPPVGRGHVLETPLAPLAMVSSPS